MRRAVLFSLSIGCLQRSFVSAVKEVGAITEHNQSLRSTRLPPPVFLVVRVFILANSFLCIFLWGSCLPESFSWSPFYVFSFSLLFSSLLFLFLFSFSIFSCSSLNVPPSFSPLFPLLSSSLFLSSPLLSFSFLLFSPLLFSSLGAQKVQR